MSCDKPGTSDATDAYLNKREVLRRQSRQIIHNMYKFLNSMSSDYERAETDYSKTWELTCDTGSVHKVSRICSEAKISVRRNVLQVFTSPGKEHNMQKRVANLDDFEKDVIRGTVFGFYFIFSPRQRNNSLLT
jgi:hypothetical protein